MSDIVYVIESNDIIANFLHKHNTNKNISLKFIDFKELSKLKNSIIGKKNKIIIDISKINHYTLLYMNLRKNFEENMKFFYIIVNKVQRNEIKRQNLQRTETVIYPKKITDIPLLRFK